VGPTPLTGEYRGSRNAIMPRPFYVFTESGGISRRNFFRYTGSLAAAAAWSSRSVGAVTKEPKFNAYPFSLGVASGDPSPDGFVLWTRLAPDPLNGGGMSPETVEVSWMVSHDENFRKVVRRGTTVARPDWAHAVHVELDGLDPDRWYWYQFKVGPHVSPKGQARTMPLANASPDRLRFAFASCQHYEMGYYTAFEHMAREDLDLIVHLGDYIYEYAGRDNRVRKHTGSEIYSVSDYRDRYALYRSDPALQSAHASAPWLVTWDDHEVDNNYADDISEEMGVGPELFLQRRANAYKAYYEHMPLRKTSLPNGPDMLLYREIAFGRLADFFVLDTRQYRSDQPCGDKTSLCDGAMDPSNKMLGEAQKKWLKNGLKRSGSEWNILAQQVMVAQLDRIAGEQVGYSMDKWTSSELERRELIRYMGNDDIKNPIVLTGDIHSNWANELLLDFDGGQSRSVGAEFVGTSISSGGDGQRYPDNLDTILSENPFVKFHNKERGYVVCEVNEKEWRTDYRTVDYVTRRGAAVRTRASFVVENGRTNLNEV